MIKENFTTAMLVINRSIGHAGSQEELFVITQQIEHLEEDFRLFNISGFNETIAELHRSVRERINYVNSEKVTHTQCGTFFH